MPADQLTVKDDGGNYEKPPEGGHAAVCADVIDLGYRFARNFGKIEHKCALVFQLGQVSEKTGERFEIAQTFTVNFGEKANLRKFLSQWRGKSYSDDEAKTGAPLHKLEGQPAYITIEHQKKGDKTYANIIGIVKLPMGLPILEVENYKRSDRWKKGTLNDAEAERAKFLGEQPEQPPHPADEPPPIDDDDLPF